MSLIFSSNIAHLCKKEKCTGAVKQKGLPENVNPFFSKLVKNEGQTVLTANDFSDV